jgi:hypothetical protein
LDLLGDAEDRFLEFEREIFAQIGAALRAGTAASALAAKHIAEDVAEDILKVGEDGGVESAGTTARAAGDAGMTEAVVARALLAVGENGVGLAALLEALFRFRIAGIAVRMVLQGKLAIGALDFLIAGGTRDAQNWLPSQF